MIILYNDLIEMIEKYRKKCQDEWIHMCLWCELFRIGIKNGNLWLVKLSKPYILQHANLQLCFENKYEDMIIFLAKEIIGDKYPTGTMLPYWAKQFVQINNVMKFANYYNCKKVKKFLLDNYHSFDIISIYN